MLNSKMKSAAVPIILLLMVLILVSCQGPEDSDADTTDTTADATAPTVVSVSPPARFRPAMARIDEGKAILFGGTPDESIVLNDTWEYDTSNHTWSEITISGDVPQGRVEHVMAYAGGTKIVMFGGGDAKVAETLFSGTWEYESSAETWTKYSISGPNPNRASAMAYAGGNKVVSFGGFTDSGINETWDYDAATHTWTKPNITGTTPSDRCCHAMAYAGGNKVVMFGGDTGSWTESVSEGTAWIYDAENHTWSENNTTGVKPDARIHHVMVYAGGSKIIMYGGFKGSRANPEHLSDTWEYDAETYTWTEIDTQGNPGGSVTDAAAYVGNGKIVLFIGHSRDTWEYDISNHTWTKH